MCDPTLPTAHGARPAINITVGLATLLGCSNAPAQYRYTPETLPPPDPDDPPPKITVSANRTKIDDPDEPPPF